MIGVIPPEGAGALSGRRAHASAHRQRDCEDRTSAGGWGCFYLSAVLAQDCFADAQAEAGAAAGTLGGEERVEDVAQVFWGDAGAVVLKDQPDRIWIAGLAAAEANADGAFVARLTDRLFGV